MTRSALYHRAWLHSDTTIDALPLDAVGHVPWWPADRNEVTLHRIMAHMIAETHRHAGHADIVRELIDGAAGASGETTTWRRATSPGGGVPEPAGAGGPCGER